MNCQDNNWWFIFFQHYYLILETEGKVCIPTSEDIQSLPLDKEHVHQFETINGCHCSAIEVHDKSIFDSIDNARFIDLRESYDIVPLWMYKAAGCASQLIFWDNNTRYCPACGHITKQLEPIMKKCTNCGKEQYPPIHTAIIVLISKGEELLMARAHNFKGNFYSLIAGFLEVGESLEECVHREVMEETHLKIKNLRYFGSQTWPYPSGIMVGFMAEYESGDIKIQKDELKSADFYHKDNLPILPKKLSLARRLIDNWLNNFK